MPIPRTQWFNANGAPVSLGSITVYAAGTTTPVDTYSCVSLSPGCVNPNPIPLNASGRPSVSGVEVAVFLTPGQSYLFILKNSTGATLWSQDHISAVPESNVSVDLDGVAGQDIPAGAVVYLSNGSGSKTPAQWYLADADLAYASTTPTIGIAPTAIASGETGSIRIQGRVDDLTGLTPGATYYVSATAGGLTTTAPAEARIVGQSDGITSLVVAPNPPTVSVVDPKIKALVNGRLTLTSNTPVTTADVTGASATTVYFTPYQGNTIAVYTGSTWTTCTFAQVSIAVPATTATVYDVFFDFNDSCAASVLAVTAWSSGTARATALATQDGVYVKTGDLQQRYLGSFRTTAVSGQTEDSDTKRFLSNYYNRVERRLLKNVATNSWTYTTATWRQANASTANQVEFIVGVAEVLVDLDIAAITQNDTGGVAVGNSIGLDSVTVPTSGGQPASVQIKAASELVNNRGNFRTYPAIGYHFAALLEISQATGVTTWHSNNSVFGMGEQTGISGTIWQ